MRRFAIIGLLLLSACASDDQEVGVEVFSSDTLPARFTMTVSGTLVMGLRADNFQMLPDKSLALTTPAALVVQKGEGTADILLLTGSKLAAQPIGTPPDSVDNLGVTGSKLRMTLAKGSRRVTLSVISP